MDVRITRGISIAGCILGIAAYFIKTTRFLWLELSVFSILKEGEFGDDAYIIWAPLISFILGAIIILTQMNTEDPKVYAVFSSIPVIAGIVAGIFCYKEELTTFAVLLFIASAIIAGGVIIESVVKGNPSEDKSKVIKENTMPAMKKSEHGISILTGEYMGAFIPLNGKIILGKNPEKCNLVFSNKSISNVHCTIEYENAADGYLIKDMSTNGTYINGRERIPKDAELLVEKETVVSLGDGYIKFKLN